MYTEAIEVLIDLERRCDTAQLTYGGVSYWPLCRQKLWSQLVQRLILSRGAGGAASLNTAPPPGTAAELSGFIVGDPALGLCHLDREAADTALAAGALTPEALFLVRPEEYLDTLG